MIRPNQKAKYRQFIYDFDIMQRYKQQTDYVSKQELQRYFYEDHLSIFNDACQILGLFILVRETNAESIKFINWRGFVPKPVNCKPKTADVNVVLVVKGNKVSVNCAGLVVNPSVVGRGAFKSQNKFDDAVGIWKNEKTQKKLTRDGFLVQEELCAYYGCLMSAKAEHSKKVVKSKKIINGRSVTEKKKASFFGDKSYTDDDALANLPDGYAYIYGDYDLYAVVHKDYLNERKAQEGVFRGQVHIHNKYWEQLQVFISGKMNVGMIQHGSQENFSGHTNERIYIFAPFPDRDLKCRRVDGIKQIKKLYSGSFNHRGTA